MKRIYVPNKKKTILIVDDDQVAVHAHREKFQSHGYIVKVADNDQAALQTLGNEPIALMILDLCLPGMDGAEVLRNVRTMFDMQALPVVVITNAYLGNLGRAALEAGATRCVTKSESDSDQMLDVVRELIGVGPSNVVEATGGGAGLIWDSQTLGSPFESKDRERLVTRLLVSAPEKLAKLRASHQALARTEQEELHRTELTKMHRQVRWLAAFSDPVGFGKIAQMANALEALLIQLHAKPARITPSVLRTVAQALDALASLFDQAAHSPAEELPPLRPPRILVVDDEIISRETICSSLGQADLRTVSMDDSLAAHRLLEQEQFDLIFLDVEMPGESGLDLCLHIREMETNRATPVVFVTSHSDFGSRAQSTLSGGNDFIAKPFLRVELAVKALTWLFKKRPQSGAAEMMILPTAGVAPVVVRTSTGLRILVAEDNAINRAVATGILEKQGHSLVHVDNGREAVEAVARETFDLILMDVQMPEMDGFEATRRIRELEGATGRRTRIVAMTAHAMAGDRERCLAAGMDDYVSKPLRKEDLLRALGEAGAGEGEDAGQITLLYNREQLLSQCDGDEELVSELVSIFHDQTPQIVQAIGEAVEKRDGSALAAQAHKLMSSLGAFGAETARTLALRLEKHGQENNFGGAKERFTELERETDKIYAALV